MRTLIRAGALTAGLSAALVLAPAAHAAPLAAAPGDNGTVKIHDASTGAELRQNEPHVCTFYLDGFGFDGAQKVDWHIEAWAPTAHGKGATVKSGALTLSADGHGRTADMSLPDGHYKLFWNFDGEHGAAKQKVFWTDCSSVKAGVSVSASASVGSSGVAVAAGVSIGAGASGSPAPSASPSASASSSPSAQGASGNLAHTGSSAPVGLLSAAAAALVGAGGYLVFRRRKAAGN
jgi:LPXTG-motif cell wall-anchored protein